MPPESFRSLKSALEVKNGGVLTQYPLGHDCLNRLKGHSRFFRTIDVDEYDLIFSHLKGKTFYTPKWLSFTQVKSIQEKSVSLAWKDENYKMPYITQGILKVKSQAFDCLYLNNIYFIHEGVNDETILPNAKAYIQFHATQQGKVLCRPEKIAATFVHYPLNCFGRKCIIKRILNNKSGSKNKDKKIIELGYAHIRHVWMSHKPEFLYTKKTVETSLFNQVVKEIEDELMDLYGTNVPSHLLTPIKLN